MNPQMNLIDIKCVNHFEMGNLVNGNSTIDGMMKL